mmetsp:Transcript_25662/g.74111  ORF Transcript_25662/g.74111 Transcript_25662/m.74111 type:complete len:230 (-) Transcript_25662:564-1253(-)
MPSSSRESLWPSQGRAAVPTRAGRAGTLRALRRRPHATARVSLPAHRLADRAIEAIDETASVAMKAPASLTSADEPPPSPPLSGAGPRKWLAPASPAPASSSISASATAHSADPASSSYPMSNHKEEISSSVPSDAMLGLRQTPGRSEPAETPSPAPPGEGGGGGTTEKWSVAKSCSGRPLGRQKRLGGLDMAMSCSVTSRGTPPNGSGGRLAPPPPPPPPSATARAGV